MGCITAPLPGAKVCCLPLETGKAPVSARDAILMGTCLCVPTGLSRPIALPEPRRRSPAKAAHAQPLPKIPPSVRDGSSGHLKITTLFSSRLTWV